MTRVLTRTVLNRHGLHCHGVHPLVRGIHHNGLEVNEGPGPGGT